MKLDRIVIEQRLTRMRYIWWRYSIEGENIRIYPLKKKFTSMDSVFLALIRDVEFVKNFMSSKYYIKDRGYALSVQDEGTTVYCVRNEETHEDRMMLYEKNFEFTDKYFQIRISDLLTIFHLLYPDYVHEFRLKDMSYYYLNLQGEENKHWYRRSFSELFKKFKEMNFENQHDFIMSKHFAGFTKKKRLLKLYSYNLCHDWHVKDEHGLTMYDELQRKFSSSFKKFYIVYYKNGVINDRLLFKPKQLKKIFELFHPIIEEENESN